MTVSENVVGAIEKTFLKISASYGYLQLNAKTILATTGQKAVNFKHEDIFTKERIRRTIVAICVDTSFTIANTDNPFHHQKLDLKEITIY